jgi:hypothetical protein
MPAWVLDYVLLHEVAHFVEREHNDRFWHLVNAHTESPRARGFLEGVDHVKTHRGLTGSARVALAAFFVQQACQLRVQIVGGRGDVTVLGETQRVIEVGSGRHQVGMVPHGIASLDSALGAHGGPQVGGIADPPGA